MGEEVQASDQDYPDFLPEGWTIKRHYGRTGDSAGSKYFTFTKGDHKLVRSVGKCIELDAIDGGIDPVAAVQEYE